LELANVGYRIGAYVLRVELKEVQDVSEKFRPGRAKAAVKVISENNNFSILRPGSFL